MLPERSSGLTLDLYHLDSAYVSWRAGRNPAATFDLYTRSLPFGGGFLLVAGLEPALEVVRHLGFTEDDVAFVGSRRPYERRFLDELRALRFTGEIAAIPEGTVAFADEPLLRVTAPFREALLLESALLHVVNVSTLVATKAARVLHAARGRPVAEFALRRGHEPHLVARAAHIAGCASTSFVGGARRLGIPASGTIPHALVQAFATEEQAFRAVAESLDRYTLLLDTYDVRRAIHTAVGVALEVRRETGHEPAAVRLDSGDVAGDARYVRAVLDEAGLREVRILASGDLDEFAIDALLRDRAPVDGFGVGTSIGTGAGSVEHGVAGGALTCVYKLVWTEGLEPPIKQAGEKSTWPGRKQVWRVGFQEDVIQLEEEPGPARATPLLEIVMREGTLAGAPPGIGELRERAASSLAALPEAYRALKAAPAYPVRRSDAVRRLREEALRNRGSA